MIIGLSGYARSGKDTVANIMVEKYGFTKLAFADPIREALYKLNPYIAGGFRLQYLVDKTGWDQAKDDYPEIRQLLQRLGAEIGREMWGPNFWIRQLVHRSMRSGERIVVPDVRYPNEAQAIREMNNSQIWRIKRPSYAPANSHKSETAMDDWKFDQIFMNNGSIKDLQLLLQTRISGMLTSK